MPFGAGSSPSATSHGDKQVRLFRVTRTGLFVGPAGRWYAEPYIEVVGEAGTSTQALVRVPAARPDAVLSGAHLTDPDAPEMCRRLRAMLVTSRS